MPDRVCVIGAGAAGLAAAHALTLEGVAFDWFERGHHIGGMWADEQSPLAYRSLHVNSSASLVGFAAYPLRGSCDFPHREEVGRYLRSFADHHGLTEQVRLGCGVTAVRRASDGWDVTLDDGSTQRYRAVVVCIGHHHQRKLPTFVTARFGGRVMHATDYWSPTPMEGRRVVVVGFGNTAVDVASEVARVAAETTLSVRQGTWIVPKTLFGIPFDRFPAPPAPGWVRWRWLGAVSGRERGELRRYGLPEPGYRFGDGPIAVSSDIIARLRHGDLLIAPPIRSLDGYDATFADGTVRRADTIICCTGYRAEFPFLERALIPLADARPPVLYKRIFSPDEPSLSFIGLIQPLGSFMPLFEHQARLVARALAGRYTLPSRPDRWRAIEADRIAWGRRFARGPRAPLQVDGTEYARALVRELTAGRRRARARRAGRAAAIA